ncbi:lytic transglycosylase IsaA [Staphylococcus ureilyticus]|uniref:transglycosylase family protein n=1 Tax=Staphylococcus ureilyticus TaxID=94138 RepID=UPI000D1C694C|nr:transglycosylase family protein [Staphylococcus ureilyticus]MDU0462508.1 transglycosylase family protein [Staphylococcus ureilyticus]MDV3052209.1 lytic transglycosylase IsaA [Staphylococcus ureilyticus]PTF28620.1 transglycosylase [Staphylococcus cohnii]UXS59652.1 transglycosylase family protein [Staphylococcus ureilyticus]
MKKSILASSLAVALGVTGYAAASDNNQAHASEQNIDKAHLAELALNDSAELNQKPLHAGAYNYNFVLDGNEFTFTSDGNTWSWEYHAVGAQASTSNTTQDVSSEVSVNTNEKSASEVRSQQSYTAPAAVEAPKASATTNVRTAQTSAKSTSVTTNTSSIDAIANQMASRTGVSAAQWKGVIQRESGGNANAVNASSGAYGLFQLLGHGEHSGMSVQDQIDTAVGVYKSQGSGAWVGW